MSSNPFARILGTVNHRLMIVSAKGGVGKSTVTVNLAAALTARGLKTGIFDADLHGPNIPALLGIRQNRNLVMDEFGRPDPKDMLPIMARADSFDMRPIQPFERYGVHIMSLALLVGEGQTIQPLIEAMGQMAIFLLNRVDWGQADVVLLDMPPGTGEPLNSLLETGWIDGVVIVTTREQLAHLDNGRLLNLLQQRHIPILSIVENMTHIICPCCGEAIELYPTPAAEAKIIYGELPILATIPFSPDLIRNVRKAAPLPLVEPDVPVAQAFLTLADQMIHKIAST